MTRGRIECFFLEPTGRSRRYLRRWRSGECPGGLGDADGFHMMARPTYCNEYVAIDDVDGDDHTSGDLHPHEDPRWPPGCRRCGRPFLPDDHWMLFHDRLYRRGDTGEVIAELDAPPGAMWYSDWRDGRGPDGHALTVRTPVGDWCPDGPSSDGGTWTRTGSIPHVTVRPSILIKNGRGEYHAFLTSGVLEEC